jgi:RNA polymerase sigma-70 factor (ECF subfamily)
MNAEPLATAMPNDHADAATKRAFETLLREHGSALVGLLTRLCRNRSDVDDLVQETAIKVWKQFGSRPWFRSPRAWLLTIGYRTYIDWWRVRQRQVPTAEQFDAVDPKATSAEATLEQNEEQQRVQRLLQHLSDSAREIVLLHYTGEMSLRQIAEAMELPLGTVKSRLHHALLELRRLLG